jgi:hypothetical protein
MKNDVFDSYVVAKKSAIKLMSPDEFYLFSIMWTTWADMESGRCFPTHNTIACEVGWSVSKMKRVLLSLESKGFVVCENNYRGDGSQTSNVYVLKSIDNSVCAEVDSDLPQVQDCTTPSSVLTYPQVNSDLPITNTQLTNTHITNTYLTTCETSFLEEEKDAIGLTNYFCDKHNQYTESIGSTKKAKVTERNVKDMKLFIKFGGLKDGVTTAPPSLETVKAYIDWVYEGGGTEKRGSFCWANVIGSISNLRKHYPQIESMLYRKQAVVSSFAGLADLVDEDGY